MNERTVLALCGYHQPIIDDEPNRTRMLDSYLHDQSMDAVDESGSSWKRVALVWKGVNGHSAVNTKVLGRR